MKVSVLVIAHNEELHVEECIKSLLNQTRKPDEIVLIAHNSKDRTATIGREYPITVYEYDGPEGCTYARIEGLNQVHGDIVLCIDGDTYADPNWAEVLVTLLEKGNVLAGTRVKFVGTQLNRLLNVAQRRFFNTKGRAAAEWIWGASFGFWLKDKEEIQAVWRKSISLSEQLNLYQNCDDYWLALFMQKRGTIEVTNKASVTSYTKERNSFEVFKRSIQGSLNALKVYAYLKKFPLV
jgi:glycosyltransferase involved in cell wall biosynthesis